MYWWGEYIICSSTCTDGIWTDWLIMRIYNVFAWNVSISRTKPGRWSKLGKSRKILSYNRSTLAHKARLWLAIRTWELTGTALHGNPYHWNCIYNYIIWLFLYILYVYVTCSSYKVSSHFAEILPQINKTSVEILFMVPQVDDFHGQWQLIN